jgi:hypothetical protein
MPQTKVLVDTLPEAHPRPPTTVELLLAELEHAEWNGWGIGDEPACPRCKSYQREGHNPDCSLATALAKARAELGR